MDPWGTPESSLSWQTYLAPFIVSNKSISPGLSHLPLDSWLPAPHFLALGIRAQGPRASSALPGQKHSYFPGTGQGSPLPPPAPPQAIQCQACSPSFCDGLVQQPHYWILSQSFMTRGTMALETQETAASCTQLSPWQGPAPINLSSSCFGGLFWGLKAVPEIHCLIKHLCFGSSWLEEPGLHLSYLSWAPLPRSLPRASLVAQWLRICLPMLGTWV